MEGGNKMITNPQVGDRVLVFQDPITEKNSEGYAKILQSLEYDMPTVLDRKGGWKLIYFRVEFDDVYVAIRKIKVKLNV